MADAEKLIFLDNNPQASKGHMFANDQRASKRIVHEAAIIIEKCDSETYTYGRMYNYSAGGIYFESDVAFQPGTQVRIDIENPSNGLNSDHLFGRVKWCEEIAAPVVLYDYGTGVEFDRSMNRSAYNNKLKVIQGGADHTET
ncbi:MAG: PilZ domain-containing protein [Desulfobacterales bacterium]